MNGAYSVYQQGTYSPNDGVDRWMGSIAQDRKGNMALGYSVVNGTDVYPGIRYTGRLAGDPLGDMTLGEGVSRTEPACRRPQLTLGRLHRNDHRPIQRLHFLVLERVLHGGLSGDVDGRLADAHRRVQAPRLLAAPMSGGGPVPASALSRSRADSFRGACARTTASPF